MRPYYVLFSLALGSVSAGAAGQSPDLGTLLKCRGMAAEHERLACYDREAAVLAVAPGADQIPSDPARADEQRRARFGLSAKPDVRVDRSEADAIEGRLKAATQNQAGKWVLTLEDGGRWVQLDSRELAIWPSAGQNIRIRRGAVGSYLANINGQVALRVRRID